MWKIFFFLYLFFFIIYLFVCFFNGEKRYKKILILIKITKFHHKIFNNKKNLIIKICYYYHL